MPALSISTRCLPVEWKVIFVLSFFRFIHFLSSQQLSPARLGIRIPLLAQCNLLYIRNIYRVIASARLFLSSPRARCTLHFPETSQLWINVCFLEFRDCNTNDEHVSAFSDNQFPPTVRIVIIFSNSVEGVAYRENFSSPYVGRSYFRNFCITLTEERARAHVCVHVCVCRSYKSLHESVRAWRT